MEYNDLYPVAPDAHLQSGDLCKCRIDGAEPITSSTEFHTVRCLNCRALAVTENYWLDGSEPLKVGTRVKVAIEDSSNECGFKHSYNGIIRKSVDKGGEVLETQRRRETNDSNGSSVKNWRAVDRCVTSSLKGFAIGSGLRGGLVLFSLLSHLKKQRRNGAASLRRLINSGLRETLSYGLFLGSFAGTFSTIDEVIGAFWGFKRTARWRASVAGVLAGPSLLLTGKNKKHTSLAIYILLRASVLAARCGIKSDHIGWLCHPLSWKYGDVLLMCLSSSQLLTAWILKPDSLPAPYVSFLNHHGGKDASILQAMKDLAFGNPISNLEAVSKYYRSLGVDIQLDPNMKIPCMMLHGGQNCISHFFWFSYQAYFRSLPVYIPLHLIPVIISHRRGLFRRPVSILFKAALGIARSSLFLSMLSASAWLGSCAVFRAVGRCNPIIAAMGTFPAGSAIIMEKKSRRMEIALYGMSRALESFGACLVDMGLLPCNTKHMKYMDAILFSLSTAIIMQCYSSEREVFNSKHLSVLDWVFGIPSDGPPALEPFIKVSSIFSNLGYKH